MSFLNNFLLNQNIIITGGNGFLGKEIVSSLLHFGANVIVLDIVDLNKIEKKGIKNTKQLRYYKCDISSEKQVKQTFKKINRNYEYIDFLINNASINPSIDKKSIFGNFEYANFSIWKKAIDVEINGSFLVSREVSKFFIRQKKGLFINISSDLGILAPNHTIYEKNNFKPAFYSVAKHGIIGLSKYLSTYWANTSNEIRSIAIAPTGVENNHPIKFKKKLSKLIPLGRMSRVSDITNVILFLLSKDSNFLNGNIVSIDGGRAIW